MAKNGEGLREFIMWMDVRWTRGGYGGMATVTLFCPQLVCHPVS